MCVVDTNAHYYSSIYLDHFCGFISLRHVRQGERTWSIYVVPNIHIYFLNFSLFELSSYWQCDFEYLRTVTTNKTSTFCGSRLPWVYDASGSLVKMILFTERFGFHQYQLQFQYYGAHVPNNQHFVLFMKPLRISDMHVPNIKQNEFETFHFISGHRLDVVYLAAVNVCSTQQVICFDGPGTKSPTIPCNQSTYQSSTFQLVCKFSRPSPGCLKAPRLIFQGMHQTSGDFRRIERHSGLKLKKLKMKEVANGTSKYIFIFSWLGSNLRKDKNNALLHIEKVDISFPYMLYEKQSCMYGGVYIIDTSSSSYLHGDEVLSLCNPRTKPGRPINIPTWDFSILIIHYEHYSGDRINVEAYLEAQCCQLVLRQNSTDVNGQTMSTNVTSTMYLKYQYVFIESYLLNLIKIKYIYANIVLDVKPLAVHEVTFSVRQPDNSKPCVYCKVFFAKQSSNYEARQHETGTFNQDFKITQSIESVLINMSACDIFSFPVWSLRIWEQRHTYSVRKMNATYVWILHPLVFSVSRHISPYKSGRTGPIWLRWYLERPEDVPHYAVWKVSLRVAHGRSYVYIEVFTDSHLSSSVYEWDHRNNTPVYITVDTGINFFFHFTDSKELPFSTMLMYLRFLHQPLYDERLKIADKIPRLDNYTFYNVR